MSNLAILLNLLPIFMTTPYTNFEVIIEQCDAQQKTFFRQNRINDRDDYYEYLETYENVQNKSSINNSVSPSNEIINIEEYLNLYFSDFVWVRDYENCKLTSDVTDNIPNEMQLEYYTPDEITQAIYNANVSHLTSYGGCGPIALMGVCDYLSKYLGYEEIIDSLSGNVDRILLAAEILSNVNMYNILGNTLVWPKDYADCFNTIMSNHGIEDEIFCNSYLTMIPGKKDEYLNIIKEEINNGMPVTMFTGMLCGNGSYAQHYSNIYGYETWLGISNINSSVITKTFLKSRLNWGRNYETFCDADILNCGQIGLMTYEINYRNQYSFYDHSFAEEFVNSNNNGEYFNYDIEQTVEVTSMNTIETNRLRTSFIEDEYLVLSPNKIGAGIAYLELLFHHNVEKMTFSAALWSDLEGVLMSQNFKVQYYKNGWVDYIDIDLQKISKIRQYPDTFTILFRKGINKIRFISVYQDPTSYSNKGRICLDNFTVFYK